MSDGGLARRDGLVGIFVAELGEVEPDPLGDLLRAGDRLGPGGEQPRHLLGRLEMTLGVGLQD